MTDATDDVHERKDSMLLHCDWDEGYMINVG